MYSKLSNNKTGKYNNLHIDKAFSDKLKAALLYKLCIAITVITIFIFLIDIFFSSTVEYINTLMIVELTIAPAIITGCIFIRKGHIKIAMISLMLCLLLITISIIGFNKDSSVSRIEAYIFLTGLIILLPYSATKSKWSVILYLTTNILAAIIFSFIFLGNIIDIGKVQMVQLIDIIVPFIFLALISYMFYRLNQRIFDKADSEIRKLKQTEEALLQSEKKYRIMTDMLPQLIFECDINGNITYFNEIGYEMFGYSNEDIKKGLNIFQVIRESEIEDAKYNFQSLLSGLKSNGNKYTAVKKNGSEFKISIYSSLIIQNSEPVGVRGLVIDIDKQHEAEKLLRESEERFRNLVDLSPNGVFLQDRNGRYLMVNHAYAFTFGLEREEFVGKINHELGIKIIHGLDGGEVYDLTTFGSLRNREVLVSKNDISTYLILSTSPLVMEDDVVIIGSTIDISEKKEIEKELEKYRVNLENLVEKRTEELGLANDELRKNNKALTLNKEKLEKTLNDLNIAQQQLVESEKMASLGILSAGVAHEINNPLNFISGGAIAIERFISSNMKEKSEKLMPVLESVKDGVNRVSKIVESLNHFSRQSEEMNERCDLHLIINNCLVMLENQIKYKIKLVKVYSTTPPVITGNDGKLHQAFLNILSNSVQAIKDKGEIKIKTSKRVKGWEIKIIDTGIGIPKENIKKIFDPFFTTKEPNEGTGLGLSITYKIISNHKGNITFKSESGMGTTVTITFPDNNLKSDTNTVSDKK